MPSPARVTSIDTLSESAPAPLRTADLAIVIPALNEEGSIGATIERCLDARQRIQRTGQVGNIEVIVVSDGSTDRTAEIARDISIRDRAVSVIVFETNRGYGAAIKEGFRQASGELVGFLDADGTCDPTWFGEMCRVLQAERAAIVLGSRMGPDSQMPWIRTLGNRIYAFLLGCMSGTVVTDTASGMRVIRRDALDDLYPLPDGLHFTPAMSARAIMSDLRVVEISMPYAERVGQSKLHALRDGVRFLLAIRDALLLYRPSRFFGVLGGAALLTGLFWGLYPVEFYTRYGRLEEWMVYRLLLAGFLVTSCFLMVSAGILADQILSLVYRRRRESFLNRLLEHALSRRHLLIVAALAAAGAIALVWPGLLEYVRTGHVTIHWSRPLAALFLLQSAALAVTYAVLQKIVGLWKDQIGYRMSTMGAAPADEDR
jgi:glycosyltransferase involved in cell wall biosynthesis